MSTVVEPPLTVSEVSKLMGLSARLVTKIFENERGVIIYEASNSRRKRASYRTIRIPRHVYERVMSKWTVE